jgi:hypothetical protein
VALHLLCVAVTPSEVRLQGKVSDLFSLLVLFFEVVYVIVCSLLRSISDLKIRFGFEF